MSNRISWKSKVGSVQILMVYVFYMFYDTIKLKWDSDTAMNINIFRNFSIVSRYMIGGVGWYP